MTRTAIDAYPLSWPIGWKRTKDWRRFDSRYHLGFARARAEVLHSLDLIGACDVVVSANVPLRRDGLPLANFIEPDDSGVAVYWTQKDQPRVMACDCWRRVRENLRAIGTALDALRAIERSGASQILERAFAGFAALPPSTTRRAWREVLGLSGCPTREQIDDAYRRRALQAHPDAGGGHEQMVELNRARDEALREVIRA
jgi:hypothetical protein